jgi:hypothetical protein
LAKRPEQNKKAAVPGTAAFGLPLNQVLGPDLANFGRGTGKRLHGSKLLALLNCFRLRHDRESPFSL